jgi:hypothetical protein
LTNKKVIGIFITLSLVVAILSIYILYANNEILSNKSKDNALHSKEEAVNKAMPLINEYAIRNNRAIANITASYNDKFNGQNQPCWTIQARFESIDLNNKPLTENATPTDNNYQHWIIGYQVVLEVNTGKVLVSQEMGVY